MIIQIQLHILLLCLPLVVNLAAAFRMKLKIMVQAEEGVEIAPIEEKEEEGTITIVASISLLNTSLLKLHKVFLFSLFNIRMSLRIYNIKILLKILRLIVHHVRSVANQDIRPWISIFAWILHIKAKIPLPSLLLWLVLLIQTSPTIRTLGL